MSINFKAKKQFTRGFYCYRIVDARGCQKFLFEVSKRTSLARILKIERAFEDAELLFVTADPDFESHVHSIDAANAYECGERATRPLLYYDNGNFYETDIVQLENKLKGKYKRVKKSGRITTLTFCSHPKSHGKTLKQH